MAEVNDNSSIQLFEDQKIRTAWDAEKEEWYFAIVDVIAVLTDSADPQNYWRVLKKRLKDEGNETITNCNGLKMTAPDGKKRKTDVANTEQLLRIIHQRLLAIRIRNELTDEWKKRGVQKGKEYAILTDEISRAWSGMTTGQYKRLKGLTKENLRDNMTDLELVLTMLAEASTTDISKTAKLQLVTDIVEDAAELPEQSAEKKEK